MNAPLRALRLWQSIGWALLLSVVFLSLIQVQQPMDDGAAATNRAAEPVHGEENYYAPALFSSFFHA